MRNILFLIIALQSLLVNGQQRDRFETEVAPPGGIYTFPVNHVVHTPPSRNRVVFTDPEKESRETKKTREELEQERYRAFNLLLNGALDTNGRVVDCSLCAGTGSKTCETCSSSGIVICSVCQGATDRSCKRCHGSGSDMDHVCSACNGTGVDVCKLCKGKGQTCFTCKGIGFKNCLQCRGAGKELWILTKDGLRDSVLQVKSFYHVDPVAKANVKNAGKKFRKIE